MLNIKKDLYDDIKQFCNLNELDIDTFCNNLLESAFLVEKYGKTPTPKKLDVTETIEKTPETINDNYESSKKNYKKANLTDDYKVYD